MLKIYLSPFMIKFETAAAVVSIAMLWILRVAAPDPEWFIILSVAGALITILSLIAMTMVLPVMVAKANDVVNKQIRQDNQDNVNKLEAKIANLENSIALIRSENNQLANSLDNAIKDLQKAHGIIKKYEQRLGIDDDA